MKRLLYLTLLTTCIFAVFTASAQQKKRPSPPDTVKATTKNGVDIVVAYSQPSLKGRAVGSADFVPYGKVWRVGANEATTIEFSKDVKIEGKELKAGKYGFYAIPGEKEWVLIFNSIWKIWGLNYTKNETTGAQTDVLRVTVKADKAPATTEQLKFMIDPKGKVAFMWGDLLVGFKVK